MPTVRLTLVVVVGTAAYLGVAVLGWGGYAAFFSHPARVALALTVFVLAGASLFTEGNLSRGVREDRGNRWVIVAFTLIGLLASFSSLAVVRCGSGQSLSSAVGSAGWSRSRLGTRWSPAVSMV
jgi:hypothetical protein